MAIELVQEYLDAIKDPSTRAVVAQVLELEEIYSSYKQPSLKADVLQIVRVEAAKK